MVCALLGIGMTSHSQDANLVSRTVMSAAEPDFPKEITNLQVLPDDISPARLRKLMRSYKTDLGVSCSYCHVEDRDTGFVDYAADGNPRKETARVMMSMVDAINSDFLARLGGDSRYSNPVTCGNCHQGHSSPLAFEAR